MKVAHISDLHIDLNNDNAGTKFGIEFFDKLLSEYSRRPDAAKVLLISGDISNSVTQTIAALDIMSEYFTYVVFVDGNHEYYTDDYHHVVESRFMDNYDNLGKVIYLSANNNMFVYKNLIVVGVNGWYDFNAPGIGAPEYQMEHWRQRSSDADIEFIDVPSGFRPITPAFNPITQIANRDAEAMRQKFTDLRLAYSYDIVAMTHTLPKFSMIGQQNGIIPAWAGSMFSSQMEELFDSDCRRQANVKAWCCGHQHYRQFPVIDGVQISCNPYGYVWKDTCGQMPYGIFEFESANPTNYNYFTL